MTVTPFRRPIVTLQGRVATGNQKFPRDQAIAVSATFFDTSGNVATVPAATLTLAYWSIDSGRRTHTSYDLTGVDDVWSYTWDSSIAHADAVSGHIASSDRAYAVDFNFRLTKNPANIAQQPTPASVIVAASFSISGASSLSFVGRNSTAFFILKHNNVDHILLRRGGGDRLLRGH